MAIQTKSFCRMSAHGTVIFEVFLEYEDTDFRTVNDDGDPDDFRIVRFFGTNGAYERTFTVYRKNGTVWATRTVAPFEAFSEAAGGPVKYESDIPVWAYS